ncbi:MAG TPA: SDR family oxidoreductase [Terrimesophilobacter sp.]|nr:SDR family oxidoreductase [Terrimesophilobacter sp.]
MITGAAGGIGAALAASSLRRGDSVFALDIAARPKALAGIEWIECDVTDERQVADAAARVDAIAGGADVLFNNAGTRFPASGFLDTAPAQWRATLETNATGPFLVAQAFARGMAAAGRGVIVNTVSQLAEAVVPGHTAYAASKAALKHLTAYAAAELGPLGIRVIGVAPGIVETAMTQELSTDPEWVRARTQRIPLGRFASPAEIAESMHELASESFAYAHGTTVVLDGGYLTSR